MNSNGLVIVSRVNFAKKYGFENDLQRTPILGLSHNNVVLRYRGFNGDLWGEKDIKLEYNFLPEDGVADLSDCQKVIQIFDKDFSKDSDLIYLGDGNRPAGLSDSFRFEGYDFGYFHSIYDFYSVVFNEIVYGLNSEMRKIGDLLNNNLLYNNIEDIEKLRTTRMFLVKQGVDLENDGICRSIGIWKYLR